MGWMELSCTPGHRTPSQPLSVEGRESEAWDAWWWCAEAEGWDQEAREAGSCDAPRQEIAHIDQDEEDVENPGARR